MYILYTYPFTIASFFHEFLQSGCLLWRVPKMPTNFTNAYYNVHHHIVLGSTCSDGLRVPMLEIS